MRRRVPDALSVFFGASPADPPEKIWPWPFPFTFRALLTALALGATCLAEGCPALRADSPLVSFRAPALRYARGLIACPWRSDAADLSPLSPRSHRSPVRLPHYVNQFIPAKRMEVHP